VWSSCNRLTDDYTEIFYMIGEGDIPFVQFKMNLKGPKSMRKVDGLSLIFIHFYVPALTPRLNSTETSLQVSENITVFANCRIYRGVINKETYIDTRCSGRIIYIPYNVGDRSELCGILDCIFLGVDISSLTESLSFL
jgi:hypothetical protein